MMRSILYPLLILAAAAALCASCGGGRSAGDGGGDGPVTIDVKADYPAEEITLQTIADIEYIPLAISPEVLLSYSDRVFHLSDRHIMVTNRGRGDIYIFHRDGTIASRFNRQGRGPGEYTTISDILFDTATGEIFVMDMAPRARILVYTIDGTHRRTMPLPEGWRIRAWNFDAETLLVWDDGGVVALRDDAEPRYSRTPYRLLSKADASVTDTLAIHLPVRYSSQTILTRPDPATGQTLYQVMQLGVTNHALGAPDGAFTLADISSDTIYRYTRERVLTPAFARTPSVHASEPRTVWSAPLHTPGFTLFDVATLDFESAQAGNGYSIRTLMYDHSTGRVVEPTFRDSDNPAPRWSPSYYDTETPGEPGIDVGLLDPLRLVEAHEKGELKGPLAEIAENLKEDDNPVVMIVKFRQ